MFTPAYFTEYLRQQEAYMEKIGGKIFYEKAPSGTVAPYLIVHPPEGFDNGNISTGVLTYKQEDFILLLVSSTTATLKGLWLDLLEILTEARNKTITSTDLGGSIHLQCIIPQNEGQLCNGYAMEGNELGLPCIQIPVKSSASLPTV